MMDHLKGTEESVPEKQSLEDVMEHYQSVLLRYATRLLNNSDSAKDVVQEAFIRLYAHWDQVVERGVPLKPWLFRTTHNAAIDFIRKESRRSLLHKRQWVEFDEMAAGSEYEEEMDARQTLVLRHLNRLKSHEREVLVLRLQENMSYKEIAAVINRSEGYVGTLIFNATKKLNQSLRQAGVLS